MTSIRFHFTKDDVGSICHPGRRTSMVWFGKKAVWKLTRRNPTEYIRLRIKFITHALIDDGPRRFSTFASPKAIFSERSAISGR